MEENGKLDRRHFLRYAGVAAGSTVLIACGGGNVAKTGTTAPSGPGGKGATKAPSATKPPTTGKATAGPSATAAPSGTAVPSSTAIPTVTSKTVYDVTYVKDITFSGKLNESPQLAAQVKAGKLPPVEKRLPEHPYVVPHDWVKPGKYGGSMTWVVTDTSDWATTHIIGESMYEHSPVRWRKDGLEIGPGLAESWEPNSDLSQWTFHFRKGVRWSDGQPWTVDDILYWWNDVIYEPALNQTPPQELRSGKGTPCKMKKVDDYTLTLVYDSPTPLAADYAAAWVKRGGSGGEGPGWMEPKHYMKQFHIKYNKKLNKKSWVDGYTAKEDFTTNPDNPTLTPWMLQTYKKGRFSTWVRNPYCYCINKNGDQLPYMDSVTINNIQDPQVMRLNIQQGKADYVDGFHIGLTLMDVSTFKSSQQRSGLNLIFWDSGSGTASMYFFNYDYHDPKYRQLFRNPKFRQALSLAYDRNTARKVIYFNQGDPTTGTMSPKAIEYHLGKGAQVYTQWRDSFVKYDPATAKKMLDELGVKMKGQYRTLPDGSPLKITLDYTAPGSPEHVRKDELLAKNWQQIGINASPNPVQGTGLADRWAAGTSMTTTAWEVGDGPNCLVYPNWLVPMDNSRWAPLEGQGFIFLGTPQAKKELNVDPWKRHPPHIMPSDKEADKYVKQLWGLYNQTRTQKSLLKRTQVVWEIMKLHMTAGPFFSGTVANYPQIILFKNGMMNVPRRDQLGQHGFTNPWVVPCPATYDIEAYFWDNPSAHT